MSFNFKNIFFLFWLVLNSSIIAQNESENIIVLSLLEKARIVELRDPDSAKIISTEAYLLAGKNKYALGICKAYLRFGSQFCLLGKMDSARMFLSKALYLSEKVKDKTTQGNAWKLLGIIQQSAGKKDSAFFSLYKAREIFESTKDSLNSAKVYNALADLSFYYDGARPALNYLGKAESILNRLKETYFLATTYQTYGSIYYNTDEYEKAIYYLLKAKAIHDSLKIPLNVATDWNLLGACYEGMENLKMARICYSNALNYYNAQHLDNKAGEVLFNIGVFFYNQDDASDSAVYFFEKGLALCEKAKDTEVILRILPLLAEAYDSKKNYKKAFDTHVKYGRFKDSLMSGEKIKQIAEMQTKYETEKKNQQIKLLGEQHKTRLAQRNFFIAGSLVLLIGLLALGFYYRQRTRIALKNEQIAQERISGLLKEQEIKSYNAMIEGQEEERTRIATDLHDRLGSMLSTVKLLFGDLNEKIDAGQNENKNQYNKATHLLDEAVLEVRRISHNLSTGMVITFGLIPALEELCESIDASQIIKCKLLYYGMDIRLDQQVEIGIFRMIQEMVSNVLKHAKAKQLTIQLNRTEDSINVTVEDDGLGFDSGEKNKGMGLKNLEARAYKMGGTYHVDSKPGRGTISIIEIPFTHDTDINS